MTLDELYRLHYARLLRFCERRVGNRHRAEEVAQEAFLQAARYFHRYDPERPLWPWLCKIAERIAQREAIRTAPESPADMHSGAFDTPLSVRPTDLSEEALLLETAMSTIPARQRTALLLRYVDDLSAVDAARLLAVDENAYKQLLWRARRRLAVEYARLAADERRGES